MQNQTQEAREVRLGRKLIYLFHTQFLLKLAKSRILYGNGKMLLSGFTVANFCVLGEVATSSGVCAVKLCLRGRPGRFQTRAEMCMDVAYYNCLSGKLFLFIYSIRT
jgi:hypothetical protein